MSREDFNSFIIATERSMPLRHKVKSCKDINDIFLLAKEYGFNISASDINDDKDSLRILDWFNKSTISPIKKS